MIIYSWLVLCPFLLFHKKNKRTRKGTLCVLFYPCKQIKKTPAQIVKLPSAHRYISKTLVWHSWIYNVLFKRLIGPSVGDNVKRRFYAIYILHILKGFIAIWVLLYVAEFVIVLKSKIF